MTEFLYVCFFPGRFAEQLRRLGRTERDLVTRIFIGLEHVKPLVKDALLLQQLEELTDLRRSL